MKKPRKFILLVMLYAFAILTGCGGSSASGGNNGKTSEVTQSWNEMNWNQGNWN